MALIVKKSAQIHTPPPAEPFNARCIRVIDLGTQFNKFNGKKQPKIMLVFELQGAVREDGERYVIGKQYTASINEKSTLFNDLKGWGYEPSDDFDLTALLGKACLINVAHSKDKKDSSKIYANIASIGKAFGGDDKVDEPHATPKAFDLSAPDWELFAEFSDWTRDTICKSPEYAALELPENAPPPIQSAEPTKQKMPLNPQLIEMLSGSLKSGAMTLEMLLTHYEVSEEQRLHFESLVLE